MTRYMLDTNTVSQFVKRHPVVARRVVTVPLASLCISAVTAGELWFGLARRPEATQLRAGIIELMRRIDIVPWDDSAAERYGTVRVTMERAGRPLAALDLLIAVHALTIGATLVTNDRAFNRVAGLELEDWTIDRS